MISSRAIALAAVLVLLAVIGVASAQTTLDCQKVWDGPSVDNDIWKCLSNSDRLKSQWRDLVYPGFCALLFVVMLVSFPIVFLSVVCCRCCCKSSGETTDSSHCYLWMWIIYALLWSCAVAVLVIFGAKLLAMSAPGIIDNTIDGPLRYFDYTAVKIIDFTSNWSTGQRQPLEGINLNLSGFTTITDDVSSTLTDFKGDMLKYIGWVPIVSYCLGAVGAVLALLVVLMAFCRCCVPGMPYCLSCIYWIFGIVFSLLAIVGTVLAYFSSGACGEVELQYTRRPGVFQWYVIPYCEQTFDFTTLNDGVREGEKHLSQEACKLLLDSCDNTPLVTATQKPLLCGNGITSESQCSDFSAMISVINDTRVKADTRACPEADKSCSLEECAAGCTVEEARKASSKILELSAVTSNASIGLSYARPLLDCNFVVDKLLGAVSDCNDLYTGSLMLGTGLFVGGLMFGLAIYIMLRGSCIWVRNKSFMGK